jgi:hypothetical protein
MIQVGRPVITNLEAARTIRITNLPGDYQRIRLRQERANSPVFFFVRTPGGIQKCAGELDDAGQSVALFPLMGATAYTRKPARSDVREIEVADSGGRIVNRTTVTIGGDL